jgi:hypothetical protein
MFTFVSHFKRRFVNNKRNIPKSGDVIIPRIPNASGRDPTEYKIPVPKILIEIKYWLAIKTLLR